MIPFHSINGLWPSQENRTQNNHLAPSVWEPSLSNCEFYDVSFIHCAGPAPVRQTSEWGVRINIGQAERRHRDRFGNIPVNTAVLSLFLNSIFIPYSAVRSKIMS